MYMSALRRISGKEQNLVLGKRGNRGLEKRRGDGLQAFFLYDPIHDHLLIEDL